MFLKTFDEDELLSFISTNEQDINIIEKIEFFSNESWISFGDQKNIFFCILNENNMILGVTKLKTKGLESCRYKGCYNWLSYCSVHPEYQGKGFSKIMIKEMFQYMNNHKIKDLLSSGYTSSGLNRLRNQLVELSVFFKINLIDENKISF